MENDMELKKSTKIYQRIVQIANNCKDKERKIHFLDFADKFRLEFIQPILEKK
jgi:hypothetical protein